MPLVITVEYRVLLIFGPLFVALLEFSQQQYITMTTANSELNWELMRTHFHSLLL
jgi:hypothetical protein